MRNRYDTGERGSFPLHYTYVVFLVVAYISGILPLPVSPGCDDGVLSYWGIPIVAAAESLNPQALSRYEDGVKAMKRGDFAGAEAFFKQAIGIDGRDRAERVGMFTTEYFPNAKLKELQAKRPAPSEVVKPAATAPPAATPPAEVPKEVPREVATVKVPEEKAPSLPMPTVIPEEKREEAPKPKPEVISHKVREGETYESIAKWYIGDERRGKEIASMNPDLSSKLKQGDVVKIPRELAKAHKKQPSQSTVAQAVQSGAGNEPRAAQVPPGAPQQKPPAPKIDDLPGVFGPK